MIDDTKARIARLAVAVMIADGRLTPDEIETGRHLDQLGLGPLWPLVRHEVEVCHREPLDIEGACHSLSSLPMEAKTVLLAALTDVAAGDGHVTEPEVTLLQEIAQGLDMTAADVTRAIDAISRMATSVPTDDPQGERPTVASATSAWSTDGTDLEIAARILGIEPTASAKERSAAYLGFIERFDPVPLRAFGADFVALAVRKIAVATQAYETLKAAPMRSQSPSGDGGQVRTTTEGVRT